MEFVHELYNQGERTCGKMHENACICMDDKNGRNITNTIQN